MKIAFFVPHITRKPGFENNVSAHVQLPCEIARRLLASGHHVDIITDSLVNGYTLPACLPDNVQIKVMTTRTFVSNSRIPFMEIFYAIFLFIKMIRNLRKNFVRDEYDIVHFFGTERMLLLSKLVSVGLDFKLIMTYNQFVDSRFYNWVGKRSFFWNHLHSVVVSMENMKDRVPTSINTHVIRHGTIKDFKSDFVQAGSGKAFTRVLFWQTPAYLTGVDICIELYRKLAPLYPDINFDLAVRLDDEFVDLNRYEREVKNGRVYRFPYPAGISIGQLLSESICVFQPFREYTYHPQFVILESLMLGIPVVSSDILGAVEMVQDGVNGFLFPVDDLDKAEIAIRQVLDNRIGEAKKHLEIQNEYSKKWSWRGYERKLLKIYRDNILAGASLILSCFLN